MAAAEDQPPGQALQDARARRVQLRRAMDDLEAALAAPTPGRVADWWEGVRGRLQALGVALADHISETEDDDGMLAQVVGEAPRLANAVAVLRREHAELADALTTVRARPAPAEGDTEAVRDDGLTLLGRLSRHRQKGADLLYEAYSVDISGGD